MSSGRTHIQTGLAAPGTAFGPAALPSMALRTPSSSNDQDDPFAPPPEGAPERPWQPRVPPVQGGPGPDGRQGQGQEGQDGSHGPNGPDGPQGQGADEGRDGGQGGRPEGTPWSSQQPGRHDNGFGGPGRGFGGGPGGSGGGTQGPRFDITDPAQRRARYGLLAGMWGFFFALFGVPQVALLLGALALYWSISSLRDKPRGGERDRASGGAAASDVSGAQIARGASGGSSGGGGAQGYVGTVPQGLSAKPQFMSAMSGIVAGSLALTMVLGLFVTQLVYKDYFDCVSDALTSKARESCDAKMPNWLEPWAKMRD